MAGNPDWFAESLRLTVFPTEAKQIEASALWSEIAGGVPDAVISRPGLGVQRVEGPLHQNRLTCVVTGPRIDWGLTQAPDAETSEKTNVIGVFWEAIETFTPVMFRFLESCVPISRLAFGAVLLEPAVDVVAAYRSLARYLPQIRIDPEGSSELLYQINRPRPSKTGLQGLKLNRLAKWSAQAARMFELVAGGQPLVGKVFPLGVWCRLELDMNTAAENTTALPADRLVPLFQELVLLGREIAQEGDVR